MSSFLHPRLSAGVICISGFLNRTLPRNGSRPSGYRDDDAVLPSRGYGFRLTLTLTVFVRGTGRTEGLLGTRRRTYVGPSEVESSKHDRQERRLSREGSRHKRPVRGREGGTGTGRGGREAQRERMK